MLLVLTGCATGPATMRTQLTSYNDWSGIPAERTYTFSRALKFQNSLEVKSYEGLVHEELDKLGFKESSDPAAAKLLVTLRPALSVQVWGGHDPFFYDPFWRPVGFYPRGRYWGGFGYAGYPFGRPYSGYGYYGLDTEAPVYERSLRLEIDVQGSVPLKRIYEGTVETSGWDSSLPDAMPYLVRALFSDFPGNNGATRNVDVLMDRK